MRGWTVKAGLVGVCVAVVLLGSSLPAYGVGGGTEVDAATFAQEWSFTVGVGVAGNVFCTGTLVDPSTVITAGHCVDTILPDTVFYGSPDLGGASQVAISSIEQNPAFGGPGDHDSAILHLAKPVTGVSPIRVATAAEESDLPSNVSVRFAGFGLTSSGATTLLHAGTGTVTGTGLGSAVWTQSGATVTPCPGDSGGPLVAKLPSGDDVLIGAASFTDGHCPSNSSTWTDLGRDDFVQDGGGVGAILKQSVSPTTGPAPLTVTFDLTGSHISDFRAATYLVDPTFDIDHPASLSANAVTSSSPVVHFTYTQVGTYNALVEVFDATSPPQSRIGSAVLVPVTVTEPPPADAQAPETTIVSSPPDPSNSASPSFGFDGDDGGGSGVASFECKLDAGPFTACTSPQDYTSLSDGSHTFQVRAIDAAGNVDQSPASYTWTLDTVPPDTIIDNNPSNPSNKPSATFHYTGLDGDPGVLSFECKLDNGVFAACPLGSTFYGGLTDGLHTFQVRAIDAAGNTDQFPAQFTWTVDTTPPDTAINAHPSNPSSSAPASFGFTGSDAGGTGVASVQCQLDGGGYSACSSPKSYSGLGDGSHTFQVRAIDAAGNVDQFPASFTWVVDTTAPDTAINAHPSNPAGLASGSFAFTGADGIGTGAAFFECKLDSGSFTACTTPQSYSRLADGSHTFQVRAIDAAGNVDLSPASFTWTVDTTPPETTLTAHPSVFSNNASQSFGFSGDDGRGSGVARFECSTDGDAFAACISPQSYRLSDGIHTFRVRAIDGAGNVDPTPIFFIVVIDTAGPTLNPTVTPNPVNLGGTVTVSAGASDPSGVASSSCGPIDTSTAGVKSVTCTATDTFGNTSSKSVSYTVKYRFLGFDSPSSQSSYKAGSTIPVKFALANNAGTKISDSAAQALGAGCFVKVRLDGAASPAVCATYDTKSKTFQADFKVPKVPSGATHINVDVYAPNGSGLVQTETEPITIKA